MTGKVLPLRPAALVDRRACEREAVRRFRASRMLIGSQLAASQAIGVDPATVANWEAGRKRVPAWALVAVEGLAADVAGRKAA